MTTKILVSDDIAQAGLDRLRSAGGVQVDVRTGLREPDLVGCIGDYAALVVRSQTRVTAAVIEAATSLRVIGRAGVGVDNIDLRSATRRGILVLNAPEGNTRAAAEHTMAMLLALARNIPQACSSAKAGLWERGRFIGVELAGKVLGVVGLGRIGSAVARYAAALGMHVVAYDPYVSSDKCGSAAVEILDLDRLLREADFITLHTPLTPQTRHIISARELAVVKRGIRIINCARGGLIDEGALAGAIREGLVAGAALDVFEREPPGEAAAELLRMPEVIATPHLGASTAEAQVTVAVDVAEQVLNALKGKAFRNAVNVPALGAQGLAEVGPYLWLAESLGRLGTELAGAGPNRIEVSYEGEAAAKNTSLLTLAVLKGMLQPVMQDAVNFVNASVLAAERGIRVSETKTTECDGRSGLISLTLWTREGERLVAGSHSAELGMRLTLIDGYRVDVTPSGYLLIVSHRDRPGVVGRIGTILGNAGINVAYMQLGRKFRGGQAVVVLGVDDPVPESVMDAIRGMPEYGSARLVEWWDTREVGPPEAPTPGNAGS